MAREVDLGSIVGPQGAQGPQGPAGADGKTPTFEIRSGHLYAIFE